MGKWIVIILATCAALGMLVHFVGGAAMGGTALQVPATQHTPTFAITWFIIGGLVVSGLFYKLVKK